MSTFISILIWFILFLKQQSVLSEQVAEHFEYIILDYT